MYLTFTMCTPYLTAFGLQQRACADVPSVQTQPLENPQPLQQQHRVYGRSQRTQITFLARSSQ